MLRTVISGAFAAALTPLRDGGAALDEPAFAPYVDFLVAGGIDGVLALGTTGEGLLLSLAERRRAAELFVAAAGGRVPVAVHCGAQSTADTAALAAHAAEAGAAAVAVIAPPFFTLDERALDGALRGRRGRVRRRCRSTSTSSRRAAATRCRSRWSSGCARRRRTCAG